MKFVHTADWQLGKAFGRFDPDIRAALTEARFDAIDTIGTAADLNGIGHVIVAGDIFDSEGPEERTIVQALSRMERHACRWWLLPGNHDFARSSGLWDRVRRRASDSVVVLAEPQPVEIETGIWLLPAPLTNRHNLDDPTEAFDAMKTPGSGLRIGLAHGSIREFGTRGDTNNHIAPDRARRSSLDYLALGDWHGALQVDARTWYSGTPEADRFQRDDPGQALLVDIEAGRDPIVEPLRTGRFQWLKREWTINDQPAFEAEYDQLLSSMDPAATLLTLTLAGIMSLSNRAAILGVLENDAAHRLRYLDIRAGDLVGRPSDDDLAALSVEGMLGMAAEKLSACIEAQGSETAVAKRALERLFVEYYREERR